MVEAFERRRDLGIELAAAEGPDLCHRGIQAECVLVRAMVRERVEDVRDRDDATDERYLVPRDAR